MKYIILFFTLLSLGCTNNNLESVQGRQRIEAMIDNPTDNPIRLVVNGQDFHVKPKKSQSLVLIEGENIFTYNDITITQSLKKVGKKLKKPNFLLNPTRSTYVLEQITYAMNNADTGNPTSELLPYDTIQLMNSLDISGHYKKVDDFLIERTWDYDIHQKYPTSFSRKSKNSKLHFIKIYREHDFLVKILRQQ